MDEVISEASDNNPGNQAILNDNDVVIVSVVRKSPEKSTRSDAHPSRKRTFDHVDERSELDRDREDGVLCPVCLDSWTSAGSHRLCSLKCGHLFGFSCVDRWLSGKQKSCPTCNAPAKKSDIRGIYATKLMTIDTSELEDLKRDCLKLQLENTDLKKQLELHAAILKYYKEKVDNVPDHPQQRLDVPQTFHAKCTARIRLDDGSCRVLAYSQGRIAISQEQKGPLWPGFGVRLMKVPSGPLTALYPLHKKEIRDLAFHPTNRDLLLSVSFDNTVKVFELGSNKIVYSWSSDQRLWSCCWDESNPLCVLVGSERGRVTRLDVVESSPPEELPLPVDQIKPVAVLSIRSSKRLNAVLCCRLLSFTVYTRNECDETMSYRLDVILKENKYSAMSFHEDDTSTMVVLTCRPGDDSNRVRHFCYKLESSEGSIKHTLVHVFVCGDQSSQLSRSSLLPINGKLAFFAFDERSSSVCGWYIGEDSKIVTVSTHDQARDLTTVLINNQLVHLILSANMIKVYQLSR